MPAVVCGSPTARETSIVEHKLFKSALRLNVEGMFEKSFAECLFAPSTGVVKLTVGVLADPTVFVGVPKDPDSFSETELYQEVFQRFTDSMFPQRM